MDYAASLLKIETWLNALGFAWNADLECRANRQFRTGFHSFLLCFCWMVSTPWFQLLYTFMVPPCSAPLRKMNDFALGLNHQTKSVCTEASREASCHPKRNYGNALDIDLMTIHDSWDPTGQYWSMLRSACRLCPSWERVPCWMLGPFHWRWVGPLFPWSPTVSAAPFVVVRGSWDTSPWMRPGYPWHIHDISITEALF